MKDIFFKIEGVVTKRMSKQSASFFLCFGILALIFLGLSKSLPDILAPAENILYLLFLFFLFLIPLSIFITWLFSIKHAWDMRTVAVDDIDPRLSSFPQNAIYAKKQGYNYRKPTKQELAKWGLDKKRSFKMVIKELWSITQEDLEKQKRKEWLYDPDTSTKERFEEWEKERVEEIKSKL